ncbi:MAG TPA: carboxypeptidase-like regulatory domain-containing protein [Casimicrobiaceae bacterium]|nr:carboxypeptidase-like regulatory domain-containing protein [Casimicrobiaceae bacterium]
MRPSVSAAFLALSLCAPALAFDAATFTGGMHETSAPADVQAVQRTTTGERLPVSFHFATREEGHELLLGGVHVAIDDAATLGRVLSAVADGPFLLASVPEGAYQVTATHEGRAQVAVIVVARGEPLRVAFYW